MKHEKADKEFIELEKLSKQLFVMRLMMKKWCNGKSGDLIFNLVSREIYFNCAEDVCAIDIYLNRDWLGPAFRSINHRRTVCDTLCANLQWSNRWYLQKIDRSNTPRWIRRLEVASDAKFEFPFRSNNTCEWKEPTQTNSNRSADEVRIIQLLRMVVQNHWTLRVHSRQRPQMYRAFDSKNQTNQL